MAPEGDRSSGNFKRCVRARALKTGESYTAALRHFQKVPSGDSMPNTDPIRIAAAQLDTPSDPGAAAVLHRAGRDIRQLMSQAHEQGARLIHFCEGAICSPNKRIMSSNPNTVAEADWTRFGWEAQQAEPDAAAGAAQCPRPVRQHRGRPGRGRRLAQGLQHQAAAPVPGHGLPGRPVHRPRR
jgi:hypothetical protein